VTALTISALLLPNGVARAETAPIRASYEGQGYQFNPNFTKFNERFPWNSAVKSWTIYNPIDGGVILSYTLDPARQTPSDACTQGTSPWLELYQNACLAHDTNYNTPFDKAGFPRYEGSGASVGKEIADYLFLKDMQLAGKAIGNGMDNAYVYWRAVQDLAGFRGTDKDQTIGQTGGAVAVKNNGAYAVDLKVQWNLQGVEFAEQFVRTGSRAYAIPLSVGARNIRITATATVVNKQIFQRTFTDLTASNGGKAGMFAFTVAGTTISPTVVDGLKPDVADNIRNVFTGGPAPAATERVISFNSQAGYASSLTVMYTVPEKIGTVTVPMLKTQTTPVIAGGVTRMLTIPQAATGISAIVKGVATTKQPGLLTVPADFKGTYCIKAYGSLFDPQAATC
jgi:hypothetical protein